MVAECPKCQESVKFDSSLVEEGTAIACENCLTLLKMKIVPEIVAVEEESMASIDFNGFSGTVRDIQLEGDQATTSIENNSPLLEENEESIQSSSEEALVFEGRMEPSLESANGEKGILASGDENDAKEDILMCIDGEATREVVGELLKDTHYRLIDIPSEMGALMSGEFEPPKVALIDADLISDDDANFFAELKKHPSLKDTLIILIGSMFEKNTKYRKEAPPKNGAHDYVGRYSLQNELLEKINNIVDTKKDGFSAQIDQFQSEDMGSSSDIFFDRQDDSVDTNNEAEGLQEAQRLARIIVSDLFIYNEGKVDEGIRTDKFYDLLEEEIEDGRQLFESRISEDLRFTSNYFEKALEDAIEKKKGEYAQDHQSAEAVSALPSDDSSLDFSDVMPVDDEATVYAPPSAEAAPEHVSQEEDSEEVKNAKRLARIIVSDIVIYNEKKVEEGLQKNNFYELLEEEIEEGRQLYASRVDKRFVTEVDYLQEAFEDYIKKKKTSVATK